jgi:hypothetical protein
MENTFILSRGKEEIIRVYTRDNIITDVVILQDEYFPFREKESYKGLNKWASQHGLKIQKTKRACLTPDTIFKLHTHNNMIAFSVTLPADMEVTEEISKELEEKLHDSAEIILSKLFKK